MNKNDSPSARHLDWYHLGGGGKDLLLFYDFIHYGLHVHMKMQIIASVKFSNHLPLASDSGYILKEQTERWSHTLEYRLVSGVTF